MAVWSSIAYAGPPTSAAQRSAAAKVLFGKTSRCRCHRAPVSTRCGSWSKPAVAIAKAASIDIVSGSASPHEDGEHGFACVPEDHRGTEADEHEDRHRDCARNADVRRRAASKREPLGHDAGFALVPVRAVTRRVCCPYSSILKRICAVHEWCDRKSEEYARAESDVKRTDPGINPTGRRARVAGFLWESPVTHGEPSIAR